jgi:hypothetical protein
MPLRSDASLWFNLPGVVAAYQPVRAPDPLLACYNMAHGGDNRYRTEPGTAPTWRATTGWYFTAASSQYLTTGIIPALSWSMIIGFSAVHTGATHTLAGMEDSGGAYPGFAINPRTSTTNRSYINGTYKNIAGVITSGVMGIAGQQGYLNGLADGTAITSLTLPSFTIYIGCLNYDTEGSTTNYYNGSISALAIYRKTLSAAEILTASRQMAYCDVNPDWSAWGRRRKWFFAARAGTYNEATSLAKLDALSLAGLLIIEAEISAGGAIEDGVGLGRINSISETVLLTLSDQVSLSRSMVTSWVNNLAANDQVSLSRSGGVSESALVVLSEAVTLARVLGIQSSNLAALVDTLSLARSVGMDETGILSMQMATDLAKLLAMVVSAGAVTYNEAVSLSRLSGMSLAGLLTMGADVSLAKSLLVDLIGGLDLSGAVTLSDVRGIASQSTLAMIEAISLARASGVSETALQVLVGAITLSRSAGIDEVGLLQAVAGLALGYAVGVTDTSIAFLVDSLTLSQTLSLAEVADLYSAVVTAITRTYVVPLEIRSFSVPAESRILVVA